MLQKDVKVNWVDKVTNEWSGNYRRKEKFNENYNKMRDWLRHP